MSTTFSTITDSTARSGAKADGPPTADTAPAPHRRELLTTSDGSQPVEVRASTRINGRSYEMRVADSYESTPGQAWSGERVQSYYWREVKQRTETDGSKPVKVKARTTDNGTEIEMRVKSGFESVPGKPGLFRRVQSWYWQPIQPLASSDTGTTADKSLNLLK